MFEISGFDWKIRRPWELGVVTWRFPNNLVMSHLSPTPFPSFERSEPSSPHCLVTESRPTHLWPRGLHAAGTSGHGIYQARIPGRVAISFAEELPNPATESSLLLCRLILYYWATWWTLISVSIKPWPEAELCKRMLIASETTTSHCCRLMARTWFQQNT